MPTPREDATIEDIQPAIDSLYEWLDTHVGHALGWHADTNGDDPEAVHAIRLRRALVLVAARLAPDAPSAHGALAEDLRKRAQAVAWALCMLEDFAGLLEPQRGCSQLLLPHLSQEQLRRLHEHEQRSEVAADRGRKVLVQLVTLIKDASAVSLERLEVAEGMAMFAPDVGEDLVRRAIDRLSHHLHAAARLRPWAEGFRRLGQMPEEGDPLDAGTQLIAAAGYLLDIAVAMLCGPVRFNPRASALGTNVNSKKTLLVWLTKHLAAAGFTDPEIARIMVDGEDDDADNAKIRAFRRRTSPDE